MAKALSISRSNISRMISGELSQLSRSVEEESFYTKLFLREAYPDCIHKLYRYLQECEAADDELDAAYKKFFVEQDKNRSQEQLQNAMEAFFTPGIAAGRGVP